MRHRRKQSVVPQEQARHQDRSQRWLLDPTFVFLISKCEQYCLPPRQLQELNQGTQESGHRGKQGAIFTTAV